METTVQIDLSYSTIARLCSIYNDPKRRGLTIAIGKSRYYNTEEESNMSAVETSVVESYASSEAKQQQCSSSSTISSQKVKLILPELTPAMQQDLALVKTGTDKPLKPLSIANRPEYEDYPLENIVIPHSHDVLCGRGGGSNNHAGNEAFRELVSKVKVPYVNCNKRDKPVIARRIVEAVRQQTPPGRFLSKDNKSGTWSDIGDGKAREKTSQALREGAPVIRHMNLLKKDTKKTDDKDVEMPPTKKKFREEHREEHNVHIPPSNRQAQVWPQHVAHMMQPYAPQAPLQGTVPLEIVRRLLMGQIDPVHLALQILPPHEAILVARRHVPMMNIEGSPSVPRMEMHTQPPTQSVVVPSTSSDDSAQSPSRSTNQSKGSDDMSSVGSSQSNTAHNTTKRALPKKKRKYVEESTV